MSKDIKTALRDFISRELASGRAIRDNDALLETGILDSMATTRLLGFIEETLLSGKDLPEDDRDDPDNFETLETIVAMVEKAQRG